MFPLDNHAKPTLVMERDHKRIAASLIYSLLPQAAQTVVVRWTLNL